LIYFISLSVPAEIVSIREHNGVHEFYIHYINFNRRLDEWVTVDKMNLTELAPPSSSSSSNNLSQDIPITPQPRTVPTSATTASTSSETPSGNTTTFFLSDDADLLNSDLSRAAALPSLTDPLPATPTTIIPTTTRGNGNAHHGGAHSVTKVKNINLIHLGRYFIKPWYFSPYPEVEYFFKQKKLIISDLIVKIRDRHRAIFSALPCPVAMSCIALTCPGTDPKIFFFVLPCPQGRTLQGRAP